MQIPIPLSNKKLKQLFLFLVLPFVVVAQNPDINLLEKINLNRNQSLDPAFRVITETGPYIFSGTPAIMLATGFIMQDSLTKRNALVVGGAMVMTQIITVSLKYGVSRPRPFVTYPYLDKQTHAGPYSFPSGHTSSSFALSTSLSLAYPKWYIIAPSYLWAVSVAYSRMHLGVHYPSDVLAGALIGAGSSFLCYKLNKLLIQKRNRHSGKNS